MSSNEVLSEEGNIISENGGHKLYFKRWFTEISKSNPKKLIFICHGMGEHIGRYEFLVRELAQRGNFVFGHDHLGHGQSEGDRVHVDDFRVFVKDLVQHVSQIKDQHPDVKCFLIGHSMGGCISILTCLDQPDLVKGIVLLGPAIEVDRETVGGFKIFLARMISSLLPQVQLGRMEKELITRNKKIVEDLHKDHLIWQGGVKAKFGYEMLKAMEEVERRASEVTTPYLLLQGSQDKICIPKGAQSFHEKSQNKDKTLKVYEGAYHQLLYEIDGIDKQSLEDIFDWIETR